MSKHFFYDYKVDLQDQLGKLFRKKLSELDSERARLAQLDAAQELIVDYFNGLESSLADIIIVSDNKIHLIREGSMIVKFTMFDNFVKFTRFEQAIEVEIGEYDKTSKIVEARIIGNIIPGEKKCVVKRIGKVHDGSHFDDKTINFFMNEAFGSLKELEG
ncbi:MAG: hypothetical protein JEZ08_14440 [Clostridiales bacterium]|nr:hypothetical protein [Clostridiales bacterium]